jgi:Nucleotidyl transferase AbiEii toxin, Type IV TA system
MSGSFQPRLDVLPPPQRRLWSELKGVPEIGFVLYGGTAIALRLGHRASVDFDFFTERPLDRTALHSTLPFLSRATVLQDTSDTITVLAPAGRSKVKLSFFAGLRLGRVGKPSWTGDGILQVASLLDLFATKLKVLLQRVEAKDYVDIAAMLKHGADLTPALAAARTLYGETFQPNECLKALVYFEGGDLPSLPVAMRSRLIKAASSVRNLPTVPRLARRLSLPIRTSRNRR